MCIIAFNMKGLPYNTKRMATAFDNNPHGVGILRRNSDGGLESKKAIMTSEEFLAELEGLVGVPHAIHLRWRTRGDIDIDNCHPFQVSAEVGNYCWMMHNGTFDLNVTGSESDTKVFAGIIASKTAEFGSDFLFHKKVIRNLEEAIKPNNKVLFASEGGRWAMLNKEQWVCINGIWYSNSYSFLPGYRQTKTTSKRVRLIAH